MKSLETTLGSEYLAIEAWEGLSEVEAEILAVHLDDPKANYTEIARRLGKCRATVARAFLSPVFVQVDKRMAEMELATLRQLAVRTLRECMEQTEDPRVRLASAVKLLTDSGLLKGEVKTLKQDNKIMVVWSEGKESAVANAMGTELGETMVNNEGNVR